MVNGSQAFAMEDARAIARIAHAGQTDKRGVAYIEHVEAVTSGLADFDLDLQIAGMLHDVVEDSDITLDDLLRRGVSERSLAAIEMVSINLHPELSYDEAIGRISTSLDATLVKIADNAHNSRSDRVEALEATTGKPADRRYERARTILYSAAPADQIAKILRRVAPPLLRELPAEAVTVDSLEELFTIFEVADIKELADWVSEYTDPDTYPGIDPDDPELVIGQCGIVLGFPMTLADFWELVNDLEEEWVRGLSDEDEERTATSSCRPSQGAVRIVKDS